MALTLVLTDLVNELDIHPAGTDDYKATYDGFTFGAGRDAVGAHFGEGGDNPLLYVRPTERSASFKIIMNGTRDEVLNNLTLLRRWIKGPNQQAARAEIDPATRPVYLKVQLDSATNATLHRIRYGTLEESGALINQFVDGGSAWRAIDVWVELILYPWGEAENEILVDNILTGSPHFLHDDGAGLGHGWNEAGTPTTSIVKDVALIGGQAQKIVSGTANDGIYSDNATTPAYHLMIASVWMIISSGTWTVRIEDTTPTSIEEVSGLTSGNIAATAEQSRNDNNGNTWYLIKVEQVIGNIDTAASVRLRIFETTGTGTAWVDGASIMSAEAVNLTPYPKMDFASDGEIVDGWWTYKPIGPPAVVATDYFSSAKSQEFTFDTSTDTEDFISTVLLDADKQNQLYTARAWVKFDSGGNETIQWFLRDGAGNTIDSSSSFSNANVASFADASATGDDAGTWYMFEMSGTNSSAPGVVLSLEATAGGPLDIVIFIDDVYIYRGTGPVFYNVQQFGPNTILNRNDYDNTNPERTSELDFYNLPGDVDPAVVIDIGDNGNTGSVGKRFYISKYVEEAYPVIRHDYEAEESVEYWTANTDAQWTDTADANRLSGEYNRFQVSGGTGTDYISMGIPVDEMFSWSAVPRKVYAVARMESTSSTLQFKYKNNDGAVTVTNDAASVETANTWELVELGTLNLNYTGLSEYVRSQALDDIFELHATTSVTDDWVDIDTVLFLPAADGCFVHATFPNFYTNDLIRIDGRARNIYRRTEGVPIWYTGSGVWELAHGQRLTRLVFQWVEEDSEHIITSGTGVSVKVRIRPRTTMLLGTV